MFCFRYGYYGKKGKFGKGYPYYSKGWSEWDGDDWYWSKGKGDWSCKPRNRAVLLEWTAGLSGTCSVFCPYSVTGIWTAGDTTSDFPVGLPK